MTKLSPSILAADILNLGKELESVCQHSDIIHLDIMDGHFVPNLALGMDLCATVIKKSTIPCFSHLMVTNPEDYLDRLVNLGSKSIVWHIEVDVDHKGMLEHVKSKGLLAGLAISPQTPPSSLLPYVNSIDILTVMSVFPGKYGQSFIPETLEKIREIRKLGAFLLEVDGGINAVNAKEVVTSGANILVSGASFFKAEDRNTFSKSIRNL